MRICLPASLTTASIVIGRTVLAGDGPDHPSPMGSFARGTRRRHGPYSIDPRLAERRSISREFPAIPSVAEAIRRTPTCFSQYG